jgi:TolA-binding protein
MPMAALRIGRLYRDAIGDLDAAEAAFRRAHDSFPTSTTRDDALLELGEILLARGRRADACSAFRQVVEEAEVGRAARAATERITSDCE